MLISSISKKSKSHSKKSLEELLVDGNDERHAPKRSSKGSGGKNVVEMLKKIFIGEDMQKRIGVEAGRDESRCIAID